MIFPMITVATVKAMITTEKTKKVFAFPRVVREKREKSHER